MSITILANKELSKIIPDLETEYIDKDWPVVFALIADDKAVEDIHEIFNWLEEELSDEYHIHLSLYFELCSICIDVISCIVFKDEETATAFKLKWS